MRPGSCARLFNMVEVTLAIAAVGIGVAGIMAMFPVAVQSSRDAVGDNYASDVANQFLSYVEAAAKRDWTNVIQGSGNGVADSAPSNPGTETEATLNAWGGASGNVYTTGEELNGSNGLYGVKCGSDFSAHVKVWKVNISDFHYGGDSTIAIPEANAKRIYVEISWPTLKPYSKREKRIYIMELFNNT